MKPSTRAAFLFGTAGREARLQASSGLVAAMTSFRAMDGVREVRLLHRKAERSKFFVILDQATVASVQSVVLTMLQIEEAFPGEQFDYDTIGLESAPLVPREATTIVSS